MEEKKRILIVCGEASGDLNAGKLAAALKSLSPSLEIFAVGGAHLKNAGVEMLYDIKDLAVLGFFDVLKKLPRFFALKKIILQQIEAKKPHAVILVDFSGFNLRLAKALNNTLPIIYYTSPQIWASRQGRIKTIKEFITKMLVFFEFEKAFYARHNFTADFVGHPLLDIVKPTIEKDAFLKTYDLSTGKTTIALLPGSRAQEIKHILPVMLASAAMIQEKIPQVQFIIAKATQVNVQEYLEKNKLPIKVIEGKTYECLNAADFALVCSGTATLEAAIIGTPFAVIYRMGLLNYLLYRPQVKIPYIGMANIVAGKKIVPEFIQYKATACNISDTVIHILKNPSLLNHMRTELAQVKESLGASGASERAARLILNTI